MFKSFWNQRPHLHVPIYIYNVPIYSNRDGLRLAIGEAHRRYTLRVNFRQSWRGHLWQGKQVRLLFNATEPPSCLHLVTEF